MSMFDNKKLTAESTGDKVRLAWMIVDEDGNEVQPSQWYDSYVEAQEAIRNMKEV